MPLEAYAIVCNATLRAGNLISRGYTSHTVTAAEMYTRFEAEDAEFAADQERQREERLLREQRDRDLRRQLRTIWRQYIDSLSYGRAGLNSILFSSCWHWRRQSATV